MRKCPKNVPVDLDPLHADSQNAGRTFEQTYVRKMPQNVVNIKYTSDSLGFKPFCESQILKLVPKYLILMKFSALK